MYIYHIQLHLEELVVVHHALILLLESVNIEPDVLLYYLDHPTLNFITWMSHMMSDGEQ